MFEISGSSHVSTVNCMGTRQEDGAFQRKGHKMFSGQNTSQSPGSLRLFPLQFAAVQGCGIPPGMAITASLSTLKSALSRGPALLRWPCCWRWTELGVKGSWGCTAKEGPCCSGGVFPSPHCGQGWRGGWGTQRGLFCPLLTLCSRSSAGSSPTEACQEGGCIFFACFSASECLGWEEREAAAVTKCPEECFGHSHGHIFRRVQVSKDFWKSAGSRVHFDASCWLRLISVPYSCWKINLVPSDQPVFFRAPVSALESPVHPSNNFWKAWHYLFCSWETELWFYITCFENLTANTRIFHDGDLVPSISVETVYHNR